MALIRKTRYQDKRELREFWIVAVITLLQSILEVVSLGYLTSDARTDRLFKDG